MTIAILLLGLGLALIVAEVLFPSFGVLSLLAAACIIGAVARAFAVETALGINFLIAVAVLVPAVILLGLKYFPRSPIGKRMVAGGLSFGPKAATDERDIAVLGKEGVVESTLRPAGIARIDGRRVDVVTRGEMLEAGTSVHVVEVKGNRVVVQSKQAAEAPGNS